MLKEVTRSPPASVGRGPWGGPVGGGGARVRSFWSSHASSSPCYRPPSGSEPSGRRRFKPPRPDQFPRSLARVPGLDPDPSSFVALWSLVSEFAPRLCARSLALLRLLAATMTDLSKTAPVRWALLSMNLGQSANSPFVGEFPECPRYRGARVRRACTPPASFSGGRRCGPSPARASGPAFNRSRRSS